MNILKSRSGWINDVSKIIEAIKRLRKAERHPMPVPHRLLLDLANNAEEYLTTWKAFKKESEVEAVGLYIVNILNAAYELLMKCGKGDQPSPGEFAEIIDDFGRYATMMHRLMNKSLRIPSLNCLDDKVKNDCAYLLGQLLMSPVKTCDLPEVCYSNLEIIQYIQEGSYAEVHRARWEGSEVAVKLFRDQGPDFEGEFVRLKFQALDSSHILKLLGRSKDGGDEIFLILELMEKNLIEVLKKDPLSLTELLEIIIQTAKGMRFLHRQNIVHRDLKPGNILLSQKYKNKLHYLVKVADFGKSKGEVFLYYTPEWERHKDAEDNHSLDQGTLKYMAPEIKSRDDKYEGKYTRLVDVFSFGITCNDLLSKIKQPNISLKELIEQSTQKDALQRPCFEVICEELWIVMQELLAKSDPLLMKPSEALLTDLKGEGEYEEGRIVKVSFKLVWPYCVTSLMRIKSNGGARIIKTERFNGPADNVDLEYRVTSKDVGNAIAIIISVRYLRWSVTNEIGSVPTNWVIRKMAVRQQA